MTEARALPDARSESRLDFPAAVARPLRDFMHTESGSAGLLLAAAVIALLWANSPWSDSYVSLWNNEIAVDIAL